MLHLLRPRPGPFDQLLVFSTNLDPATGFRAAGAGQGAGITDDAFLRRIPNKIGVGFASPAQS